MVACKWLYTKGHAYIQQAHLDHMSSPSNPLSFMSWGFRHHSAFSSPQGG